MARAFDGSSYVIGGIGSLVGIGNSGHTIAAICRRGANGAWHTPLSIETSANSSRLSMQFSDTNTIQLIIGSSNKDTTVSIGTADDWVLAAVTRASGTSVPRGHKYVYSSNTWTHTDAGASTGGDSTDLTGGRIQIGRWQTTDIYNGDILLVAAWERALTDGELESLPFTLGAWLATAPDALWLLDQAATTQSITDLTGNGANQTSLTGTSVSTGSVPLWSYGIGPSIAIGKAGGGTGATVEPSTVAAVASVPSATVSVGSNLVPATVAAIAAVPVASLSTGSRVTAAPAAATAAVPSPALATGSTVTAATVAVAAAVSAPTLSTGSTVNPAAAAATAAVPAPNLSVGSTLAPSTVAALASVPSPAVSAGGNATVTPDTVAAAASVSNATASAGSTITVTTVAGVAAIATVSVAVGTTLTPGAVAAVATIPGAGIGLSIRATSVATVTAGRTSTTAVSAGRTSTSAVTTSRTSSSSIGG